MSSGALVGHWTFDEASSGTATTVLDSSGNNRSGTATGGVTYTAGKVGTGALSFDGSTGYVRILNSHNTALDMAGPQYTVAWWAKVDQVNGGLNTMIGNDDGQDYADGILLYTSLTSGSIYTAQNSHSNGTQTVYTGYNFSPSNLGKWVQFALTYDNTTHERNFYVNGALYGTFPTSYDAGTNQSTDLYFGRYTVNNSGYFNGSLDDVRIYDNALTASEIAQLVPEPTTLGVLGLGGLLALGRRRRRLA
jgi:hypothetical protein